MFIFEIEWNFRPVKAVIPRIIYPHVQVPNVGNYPVPGIDHSSDARHALTWLTRFLHSEERFNCNFCLLMSPSLFWLIFSPHISQRISFHLCWCFLLCLDIINYCHAKSFQLFWVGWFFYLCVAFMFGNLYLKWSLAVLRRYFLSHRMLYWFLYLIFM